MDNVTKSSHPRFTMFWFPFLAACSNTETEEFHPSTIETLQTTYATCFPHIVEGFGNPYTDIDNYPLEPTCSGTKRQDFASVEHVVFLGDSITVGTYPTPNDDFYRSILANQLAAHYHLTPPDEDWFRVNYDCLLYTSDAADD